MQKLLDLHETMYDAGARNFVFVDVPPIHRSPGGSLHYLFPSPQD